MPNPHFPLKMNFYEWGWLWLIHWERPRKRKGTISSCESFCNRHILRFPNRVPPGMAATEQPVLVSLPSSVLFCYSLLSLLSLPFSIFVSCCQSIILSKYWMTSFLTSWFVCFFKGSTFMSVSLPLDRTTSPSKILKVPECQQPHKSCPQLITTARLLLPRYSSPAL